jgi:Fe-S-cluster formation regulator IscX/YfhJ
MSNPTPEFVMEAQGIAFNFVQLRITVASLEEFSLDNARYEEIAFQVEQMQSAFQEKVRQFRATFAPDKTMQMPRMTKSQFAFEMDGTPAAYAA